MVGGAVVQTQDRGQGRSRSGLRAVAPGLGNNEIDDRLETRSFGCECSLAFSVAEARGTEDGGTMEMMWPETEVAQRLK